MYDNKVYKHPDNRWYAEISYNEAKLLLQLIPSAKMSILLSYNDWIAVDSINETLKAFKEEFEKADANRI